MKPKMMIKLAIDIVMTVIMLLLMAYVFTGYRPHMWLGISEFILCIIHNILNRKWYFALFKGKYNLVRTVHTVVNIAVFSSMIGLMISGIILSNAFGLIRIHAGRAFARQLHMLSSYWGFLLMSLHLGLHWRMIMGMLRKRLKPLSRAQIFLVRIAACMIALNGIYAFIDNEIISYMLLAREFAGFDMTKGMLGFIAEHIAMMGIYIFIAHYATVLLRGIKRKEKQRNEHFGDQGKPA